MRSIEAVTALCLASLLAAASCDAGWDSRPGDDDDTVLPAGLVGIGVSPIDPTVTLGEQIQFIATGFYDDQTTRTLTDSVDWFSTGSGVLQVSSSLDSEGLGTATGPGQAHVSCEFFGLASNAVKVTVTEATIVGLEVTPGAVQLHAGESVQLQADASFSDGSHGNVTGSVRWITEDPATATVEVGGKVTGEELGTTWIRVLYETGTGEFEGTPATVEVLDGTVVIDEPDVRILGMTASASAGAVTWTVNVKNSGGSPAGQLWVDVWLNRTAAPPPAPASGDASQLVASLAPGESQEVTIVMTGVAPGTYLSWALVDSFDGVSEGGMGENNNIWGGVPLEVTSSGGPIGPELSITYLDAWVQEPQAQVLFVFDVTNTGDSPALDFAVGIFADPEFPPVAPAHPDELVEVPELEPGETAYLSRAVRDMPEQWWQSYVLADSWDDITEPNEGNNLSGIQVVR